jgi:hypothetical protein
LSLTGAFAVNKLRDPERESPDAVEMLGESGEKRLANLLDAPYRSPELTNALVDAGSSGERVEAGSIRRQTDPVG